MARNAPGALEALSLPDSPRAALATLAEPIRRWFAERFLEPTLGQRFAWPALAAGKNLLLCAPTGTGKTLAAFLPIVSRLVEAPLPGTLRCLYVAPLKALVHDTRRTLRRHFAGLHRYLAPGSASPMVACRTGDTSTSERRRLPHNPPDILLTTPESLAVMLTHRTAGDLLGSIRWLIVDEVHALAPTKRGADLSLSLERVEELTGTLVQRIGLSATCSPVAAGARFLAGAERPCAFARVADGVPLDLRIEPLPPADPDASSSQQTFIGRLLARLEPELLRNRTTLIFTNVRSLAERLTWALRWRYPSWTDQIAVHHSSLACGVRRKVERSLKRGRLRVVVSSTSLELGIDIGHVDGVVLVHPPGGVVRLLQRIGRSGHQPGRVRRGLVLTATPAELLEATVTGAAGLAAQVDVLRCQAPPLDVLCQHLLGMAVQRLWKPDRAFEQIRRASPYCDLSREDFDACLAYLSGQDAEGRPWLPARLTWDVGRFTLAGEGTGRLLRRNLGTILTEETRQVRLIDGHRVGQVDEIFADRLQPGDRFVLDGRCFEFKREEKRELAVEEVMGRPRVPHWVGEGWPLNTDLARRLYALRTLAAEALREGPAALAALLHRDYGGRQAAGRDLVAYFMHQESVSEIPGPATCLIECVPGDGGCDYYVHTPLGRAGNDALARVAAWRLARDYGRTVVTGAADLGLMLLVRGGQDLNAAAFRLLLSAEAFDADLANALADSDLFRERFRRVALTGFMLLRHPNGGRRRVGGTDWAQRRLFDQVRAAEPNFVLLRQAEREVREECCDAAAARAYADVLPRLEVRCRWLAEASPFASSWTQAATGATESPETPEEALERLHGELTRAGRGA
jgi:ATP-dependent helicase Lhr and Lhr-like helicase